MAKRFTDSRIYQDPWFRKLKPKYKLFWHYLLCACNHAGVWKVDFEMANFCIGEQYDKEGVLAALGGRIVEVNSDKWFIPKFITFQYSNILNNNSRACISAINLMKEETVYKLFTNSYLTVKNKDKNKVKDKDTDKDIGKSGSLIDNSDLTTKQQLDKLGVKIKVVE